MTVTNSSRAAVLRLFPTLCANPELAELLARCETWLQQNVEQDNRDITRVLGVDRGAP